MQKPLCQRRLPMHSHPGIHSLQFNNGFIITFCSNCCEQVFFRHSLPQKLNSEPGGHFSAIQVDNKNDNSFFFGKLKNKLTFAHRNS